MQAGIGGRTVGEAKQRIGYGEALQWFAYRKDHGGVGLEKTNRLLAQIAMLLNRALGGETTFEEIYCGREPDNKHEDEDGMATLQDIMNELGKALS